MRNQSREKDPKQHQQQQQQQNDCTLAILQLHVSVHDEDLHCVDVPAADV
jgi:hypothetical protein